MRDRANVNNRRAFGNRMLMSGIVRILVAALLQPVLVPGAASAQNSEARTNNVQPPALAPGWATRAIANQRPSTSRSKMLQSSTVPAPGGVDKKMLAGGIVMMVGGAAMLAYGSGEYCKTAGANGTSDCGYGKASGVAFMALGALFATLAGQGNSKQDPVYQPAQPRYVPPVSYTDPVAVQDANGTQREIDQIRSGVHGEVPPPQMTGRNRRGVTTAQFQNDTAHTLYLYLSGSGLRPIELVVAPGGSQFAALQVGNYEVGARVSAANVVPFYGNWTIESGGSYQSCFYINSGCR